MLAACIRGTPLIGVALASVALAATFLVIPIVVCSFSAQTFLVAVATATSANLFLVFP